MIQELVSLITESFKEARFEITAKFSGNWITLILSSGLVVLGVTTAIAFF